MAKLLIVDGNPLVLEHVCLTFAVEEITVLTASTSTEALQLYQQADVVLLDLELPDQTGLELFRRMQQIETPIPVILTTERATPEITIDAMRLGAFDLLIKPIDSAKLTDLVRRALEVSQWMRVPADLPQEGEPDERIDVLIGTSPAMHEVHKQIGRVAPQDVTVLILGDSGSGKELVARAIAHYSRRPSGHFLAVNCAAIPDALLESELFGHEKGAFTGADRKRLGKLEQCNKGTLFLDEVGDMPLLTQAKILRVLQEQSFERVGGNETIQTNVRIIAATNQDLGKMILQGTFREDLYYRLSVFTIKLPPLRARTEDLGHLVDHFLRRFNRELGKNVRSIAPEALALLKIHHWPGNVRELQSVLKQSMLNVTGSVLLPQFLPEPLQTLRKEPVPEPKTPRDELSAFVLERLKAGSNNLYSEWEARAARDLLLEVLEHCQGNLTQAAKVLGITRSTLRARMTACALGVDRKTSVENH